MSKRRNRIKNAESSPPPAARPGAVSPDVWICAALAAAILAIYLPVLHFEFTSFDDPVYVTENPQVQAGLSAANVAWALTTSAAGSWFPLTWISHMLDCQLFGLDAGWHHFDSVLIHLLGTLAWFLALQRITGARWRSALAAFLFALHPLHVESVAWVCERKDVLSGLLGALTLWAYAEYARKPGAGRYAITLGLFCLGLMAKPMLVTVPALMLLLDWWPLARGWKIVEKIPFAAASAADSAITYWVHAKAAALPTFEQIPPGVRVENALVSYAAYLWKMVWPVNLGVFYPYPRGPLLVPALAAGVAIAGITVLAWRARRAQPWLLFGWSWFVIALLPVIGLVQAGAQARADRFTYIPMIGISVAAIWEISAALASRARVRVGLAAAVCAACMILSAIQVSYWRDSVTLYRHTIAVTDENAVIRFNLAAILDARGERADAVSELRETVRVAPQFAAAHAELGQLLAQQGQADQALAELETAVRLRPEDAAAHFRLGSVLGSMGRTDRATGEFLETIHLDPENADAHFNLANAYAQAEQLPQALSEFRVVEKLRPQDADARFLLGITLVRMGRLDDGIAELQNAVKIRPDFANAREALADAMRMRR